MTAPLISVVELRPNGPSHLLPSQFYLGGGRVPDQDTWFLTRCGLNIGPLDLVYEVDSSDADLCKRCLKVKNHS